MKKLTSLLMALMLMVSGVTFAQSTKPAAKPKPVASPAAQQTTAPAAPKTTGPVKKDGTPDKRFKENKKMKKDGTPDMRYKENKKAAAAK